MLDAIRQYEVLLQASGSGIALVAPDGAWLTANPALCEILGYSEAELQAIGFQEITHPDDLENDLALVQEILDGTRDRYHLEKRYIRKDRAIVHAMLSVGAVRGESGELLYFVSQIQDVTDRVNLTTQLRAVLEAIPAAVLIRDRNGICTEVLSPNKAGVLPLNQILNKSICDVAPPQVAGKIMAAIRKALSRQSSMNLEYPLVVQGESFWFQTSITPLNDREVLIIATDNTENRQRHLELYARATRDPMTGLSNRAAFIERIEEAIASQKHFDKSFAMLIIDVDRLTKINDDFGHPGGDKAIVAIAQQLRTSIRQGDAAARLTNGDEFAMLLLHIDAEAAIARANQIRQAIRDMVVRHGDRVIPVSVSIGVAIFPCDGLTFEQLYEFADRRLQCGKHGGRDRVCAG